METLSNNKLPNDCWTKAELNLENVLKLKVSEDIYICDKIP